VGVGTRVRKNEVAGRVLFAMEGSLARTCASAMEAWQPWEHEVIYIVQISVMHHIQQS